MPEHLHYEDDDAIVNAGTLHEESDINVRALLLLAVIFVIFAIFTHFGLWMMFRMFRQIGDRPNAPLTQMQRPPDASIPQEPRLQPFPNKDERGVVIVPNSNTPVTDMQEMRASEDRVLNHYGWADQQKGVVHIPIEEAKRLLLQRATASAGTAPPRPAPATAPSTPGQRAVSPIASAQPKRATP